MKILVTGSAGFIGYHLSKALAQNGDEVIGIDNINDYYDVSLKYGRLADLGIRREHIIDKQPVISKTYRNYTFLKLDITDKEDIGALFRDQKFDVVCHLAAQAGVRYSLVNPQAYIDSNIQGFLNILECCRENHIKHLVYASSSSVYGLNKKMPFSTHSNVDHPISLYAASKKSNELMAHTYSYLFNLPTTGLRFFTVYGPWSRPDMAMFLFTQAILEGRPIQLFNMGQMRRDFTYVDDIIGGVMALIDKPPGADFKWNDESPDPASSLAPYRVLNIGRGKPVNLLDFVSEIEKKLGTKAKREYLPLQSGDLAETWAEVDEIEKIGYEPRVGIEDGVPRFVNWFKDFYNIP